MIHHDPKISGIQSYTWILIFPFTQQKKNIKPLVLFSRFSLVRRKIRVKCTYLYHYRASFFSSASRKFSVCRNIDLIICNSLICTRDFVWRTHEWTKWPLQRCAITVVSDHLVFVGYHGVLSETMEDRCFFRRSSSQWMSYIHGRPLWMAKGLFPDRWQRWFWVGGFHVYPILFLGNLFTMSFCGIPGWADIITLRSSHCSTICKTSQEIFQFRLTQLHIGQRKNININPRNSI